MTQFIHWFNESAPEGKNTIKNPVIRSAIAHLYFESIHPFEDAMAVLAEQLLKKLYLKVLIALFF